MRKIAGTLLGKSVAGAVKLRGRSSGQALPGLVVEKLIPNYLQAMLKQLPDGVAIITGTNGKTTTTKMVVELLRANGKKVLTNPTGSNMTRGIISSVSQQAHHNGRLPFDIAVLELDEAYARQFAKLLRPSFVLGLNASRDQLDRFGEVDTVARYIAETMLAAKTVITNADDKRLSAAVKDKANVHYFGVSPKLLKFFPRDDELVAVDKPTPMLQATRVPIEVELTDFKANSATYKIGDAAGTVKLNVTGQHNFQNAAAALALVHNVLPEVESSKLIKQLELVKPAFGRGQIFTLEDGSRLQLNLVKNPASFRQGLASYVTPDTQLMVAINDRVADSRDMSWLWDVDFSSLKGRDVQLTTGKRAVDMALRFRYDDVLVHTIEPDINKALQHFTKLKGDKVIFASYTAMLHLHAKLEKEEL